MTFEQLQKTIAIGALLCLGLFQVSLHAQISIGDKPYSFTHDGLAKSLAAVTMPGINLPKLKAEDVEEELVGIPPRFGYPIEANLNMNNSGQWQNLPNGGRLWRLAIEAPGAKSINLLYNDFYLPGNGLNVFANDVIHFLCTLCGRLFPAKGMSHVDFLYESLRNIHYVLNPHFTPSAAKPFPKPLPSCQHNERSIL